MRRIGILVFCVVVALLIVIPPMANGYYRSLFYITLLYVALAYGWNVISGYAGYFSFGQVTFFGLGAYVTAIVVTKTPLPWEIGALLGGVVSAAFAVPLGYLMLRLRGPFFALGMLGLARTLQVAANSMGITGGGQGLFLPPGSNALSVYYWTLAIAVLAFAGTWLIDHSAFGLRLQALREDEQVAATLGVHVTTQKVYAFIISAAIPGLLGGGYAWYLTYVNPVSVFSTSIDLQAVAMTILGGIGTVWGPLIGGVLISQISEALAAQYPQAFLMIFGGLVVALLVFLPRGIAPACAAALSRRRARAKPAEART
ncbi:MAG: branched-chain amino acid ABC transporter permease [bacterium]|nr:branched-chain amino acid ABC transporter permease [bacterium]